jgi:hypothetical protein
MGSAGGAAAAYVYLKQRKDMEQREKSEKANMRRWECVQLGHHNDVGRKIEEWESNGWVLYSYETASFQSTVVNHYLLFFKED